MHPINKKYPEVFLEDVRRNVEENPFLVNVMENLEHVIKNFENFGCPTARLKECPYYDKERCIYTGKCLFLKGEGCYLQEDVYPDIRKFLSENHSH